MFLGVRALTKVLFLQCSIEFRRRRLACAPRRNAMTGNFSLSLRLVRPFAPFVSCSEPRRRAFVVPRCAGVLHGAGLDRPPPPSATRGLLGEERP